MYTLNRRQCLGIAAVGAFVSLTALGPPARADELVQHLGPVGAHEPILTTFGNKRVIADRKSTRLNSSHLGISYAVFCLKKKNTTPHACSSSSTSSVRPMPPSPAVTYSANPHRFASPNARNRCTRRCLDAPYLTAPPSDS